MGSQVAPPKSFPQRPSDLGAVEVPEGAAAELAELATLTGAEEVEDFAEVTGFAEVAGFAEEVAALEGAALDAAAEQPFWQPFATEQCALVFPQYPY